MKEVNRGAKFVHPRTLAVKNGHTEPCRTTRDLQVGRKHGMSLSLATSAGLCRCSTFSPQNEILETSSLNNVQAGNAQYLSGSFLRSLLYRLPVSTVQQLQVVARRKTVDRDE